MYIWLYLRFNLISHGKILGFVYQEGALEQIAGKLRGSFSRAHDYNMEIGMIIPTRVERSTRLSRNSLKVYSEQILEESLCYG